MMTDTDQTIGRRGRGREGKLVAANDNVEGKDCSKCLEWRPLTEYHTAKTKNGGRRFIAACKLCTNAVNKAYARKNAATAVERVRQWRLLPGNKEKKNEQERARNKVPETAKQNAEYNREWSSRPDVRERRTKLARERNKTDPVYREKRLSAQREYYSRPDIIEIAKIKRNAIQATPEWKDKFNARRRERYQEDPEFFCAVKCRAMVVRSAKKAKTQKLLSTTDSLGYSPGQLRLRLECQFKSGMSWDNHGEWHIDHKKPMAAFLAQGIKDPKTINALCNLQPMWGVENQKKSATWIPTVAANDNVPSKQAKAA